MSRLKINPLLFTVLCCFIFLQSCKEKAAVSQKMAVTNTIFKKESIYDAKIDSLLAIMTLEEKIGQMNQYNGFMDFTGPVPDDDDPARKLEHIKKGYVGSMLNVRGVKDVIAVQKIAVEESRLGIPLIIGFDVIHGYETLTPIPLAEAASWDLEAIQESARLAAKEASAAGINWTFAPMVDISRDARWGRVMEGAGEDPYLGSLIAKARINGFQGTDLLSNETIIACAKHFAAYGLAEAGRDYNTADLGPLTMNNIILPPFKAANDAGVRTFMNAFNDINGIPATAHKELLTDILKDKWAFDGFVVSDWGSVREMITHNYSANGEQAAMQAVNAGTDMDMESYLYVEHLANLVRNGKVKEETINEAARRILKVKYELGLFENPFKYCDYEREKEVLNSEEMNNGALDMARKSIVLLKNEGNLLPLQRSGQKVALIGALASDKTSPLGSWRLGAADGSAISVLEGMRKFDPTITYLKGPNLVKGTPTFTTEVEINTTDRTGFNEAIQSAQNADVVVMVLGEHAFQSGEGRSRTEIGLPGLQQELLEKVYAVNKNIILVLNNGRPLAIPWAAANIPSIVEAWHLGTQSGNAIADILYGAYNPSGKLPVSFPKHVGQLPLYYNHKHTGKSIKDGERVVFWSHYQDMSNEPEWYFGHGLSYTTFEYSDFKVSDNYSKDGTIIITANLKNTGTKEGKETAQLYIQDEFAKVIRPVRELKGFKAVTLKPGETQQISFTLKNEDIGYFDNDGEWFVEDGIFNFWIGGSVKTTLKKSIDLKTNL